MKVRLHLEKILGLFFEEYRLEYIVSRLGLKWKYMCK